MTALNAGLLFIATPGVFAILGGTRPEERAQELVHEVRVNISDSTLIAPADSDVVQFHRWTLGGAPGVPQPLL